MKSLAFLPTLFLELLLQSLHLSFLGRCTGNRQFAVIFFWPGSDTLQDKDVGWRSGGLTRLHKNPPEYQDMGLVPGLGFTVVTDS